MSTPLPTPQEARDRMNAHKLERLKCIQQEIRKKFEQRVRVDAPDVFAIRIAVNADSAEIVQTLKEMGWNVLENNNDEFIIML